MGFLTYYLTENIDITIKTLEDMANNSFLLSREEKFQINFFIDYYHEKDDTEKKWVTDFLKGLSNELNKAVSIISRKARIPYIDTNTLIRKAFDFNEIPDSFDKLWPIPIYISAKIGDKNTIGILVHKDGKVEMFEGNDEASDETYALVNKIMGKTRDVEVWGSHGIDVVEKIKKTHRLPEGLFVSPNKMHASGYWGAKRQLFSCIINTGNVRQESDIDWKVIGNPTIKNFRTWN